MLRQFCENDTESLTECFIDNKEKTLNKQDFIVTLPLEITSCFQDKTDRNAISKTTNDNIKLECTKLKKYLSALSMTKGKVVLKHNQ